MVLKAFTDLPSDLQADLEYHKNMLNVSKHVFYRNAHYTQVNGIAYHNEAFDQVVDGDIKILWQNAQYLIAQVNTKPVDYRLIPAADHVDEPFTLHFKFNPSGKGSMHMTTEKVVGTTFAFKEHGYHPGSDFDGELSQEDGRQVLTGKAVLLPDPNNEYDANAIAVVAKLKNGQSFPLGYLAKGSALYQKINTPTLADLKVINFSNDNDFNDSYTVSVPD